MNSIRIVYLKGLLVVIPVVLTAISGCEKLDKDCVIKAIVAGAIALRGFIDTSYSRVSDKKSES